MAFMKLKTASAIAFMVCCLAVSFYFVFDNYGKGKFEDDIKKKTLFQKKSLNNTPTLVPTLVPTLTPVPTPRIMDGGRLFNLVNSYRRKNGLNELLWYHRLCDYAKTRSQQVKDDWSHDGYQADADSGKIFGSVCTECQRSGENLAKGFFSEESILQGWIKSPSHKENLDSDWDWGCAMFYSNNYVAFQFGKKL